MSDKKKCHHCGGEILAVAKKCKHCKQWLDAADGPSTAAAATLEGQQSDTPEEQLAPDSRRETQGENRDLVAPDMTQTASPPVTVNLSHKISEFAISVNRKRFLEYGRYLQLHPSEEVLFFEQSCTPVPNSANLRGLMLGLDVIVTDERMIAFARDAQGKIYMDDFSFDQIMQAVVIKGRITNELDIIVADPTERYLSLSFGLDVNFEAIKSIHEGLKRTKGGFENVREVTSYLTKDEQATLSATQKAALGERRAAEFARHQESSDLRDYQDQFYKAWLSSKGTLIQRAPGMFEAGNEVTVGVRNTEFDSWVTQNLAADESIVARCYSGDEALIVTSEKVILLKKGRAKAAVSASGVGTMVGVLTKSWAGGRQDASCSPSRPGNGS